MRAAAADDPAAPRVLLATSVGIHAAAATFDLVSTLRDAGVAAECDHQGRSLKSQLKQADKLGAGAVIFVGPRLASDGVFEVKHMGESSQADVPGTELASALSQFATGVVDDERLTRLLTERFGF
jgi:histidyl-tRNA synthetase